MGSICCKESGSDDGFEYESDRQRIMPESDSMPSMITPSFILPSNQGDLNSQMDNIVKHCENQVVDVCLMDAHMLDSSEYIERAKFYSTQLRNSGSTFPNQSMLPNALGNPLIILSCPTLSESELTKIKKWSAENYNCVDSAQLKGGEELVIHFDMP